MLLRKGKHGLHFKQMDSSPLNKAHREQRRAEASLRGGRIAEAIDCHRRAAELLTEALTLSDTPIALQSINLQHNFHIRQQEVLRFRCKQQEKYAKAMENHRMKIGAGNNIGSLTPHPSKRLQALTLELTKNTERTESLFSLLIPEDETCGDGKNILRDQAAREAREQSPHAKEKISAPLGSSAEKVKSATSKPQEENAGKTDSASIGIKKEKDNALIVEELRTLRDHQNDLISQLMTEIAHMEKENVHLKNQVRDLQSKCEQYEGEKRRLRAMADSSCSPFVFSPLSEFSPDPPSFPDLAPLEMPPLDFIDNYDKD